MNDKNSARNVQPQDDEETPRQLNKWLIGLGVLVFGLIIIDRFVDTFRADDMADYVETVVDPDPLTATPADTVASVDRNVQAKTSDTIDVSATDLKITEIFGSRLVFVSASEPMYVVTDDDRRIAVGDSIDDTTTLAGITGQRVVLEKGGELLVVSLPEPDE